MSDSRRSSLFVFVALDGMNLIFDLEYMDMKKLILAVLAVSLFGCGDDTKKAASNNLPANNGSSNNSSSNNTSSNNGTTTSANNTSSNNVTNNAVNNVSTNNLSNNGSGAACETGADCTSTQECASGFCEDHVQCESAYTDGNCTLAEWGGCADGKDYRGECDYDFDNAQVVCQCFVNDVEVLEFVASEDRCDLPPHRLFNLECGWLMPEAF